MSAKTLAIFIGFGISAQTPVTKYKNEVITARNGQLTFM